MAGIDSFTTLMLHCNGADGSTSFPDSSSYNQTVVANGTAQVDTAQSKFGGASFLAEDLSANYLSIDTSDFNTGSDDFTLDFWFQPNITYGTNSSLFYGGGFNIYRNGIDSITVRFTTNITEYVLTSTSTTNMGTWTHIALVRNGSTLTLYLDGVAEDSATISGSKVDGTSYNIGFRPNTTYGRGWFDEYRFSNGIARWTTGFTPPTSEYTLSETINVNETITLSDSEFITTDPEQFIVNETITLSDDNFLQTNPDNLDVEETITLNDNTLAQTNPEEIIVAESITLSDSFAIQQSSPADFASKVIHYNPLYYVTNTDPAKIVEIDITDPTTPVHASYEITGAKFAKDVSINTVTNKLYVACADGIVAEIDQTNLLTQSLIDLSDLDDLETISTLSEMGLTYTGTENAVGELYLLDDRSTFSMDSDFQLIAEKQVRLDSDFKLVQSFEMGSDFNLISEKQFIMDSDFKLIEAPPVNTNPIVRDDFHVFINGVELEDTDVDLSSITIQKAEDNKDSVEFKLTRRHDDLNNTLSGVSSIITNQNDVEVKIKSTTFFTGKVGIIHPNYNTTTDQVNITAYGSIPSGQYNKVLLSLPGQNEPLNLFHILLQNYNINNEYIDPQESNPRKYKGISVSLGEEITQHVVRYTDFDTSGNDAKAIQDGTFVSRQNWTYFWSPTVRKIGNYQIQVEPSTITAPDDVEFNGLKIPVFKFGNVVPFGNIATGDTTAIHFKYIGTSLSPVSNDLWELLNASRRRQKILQNTSVKIGTGGTITIGDLDEIVDDGSAMFTELQSKGWINGSGVIQDEFKFTTEPSELKLSSTSCEQSQVYSLLEGRFGYSIGSAPFKNISTRNGKLITKYKWVDGGDGLYSVKDESYDYTNYAKKVAQLEYQKLSNINGDIQPDTSCNIELTIDALIYFNLGILTRINIDNTVQAGIYNNNNGFPVSIKGYTISSADMKVTVQADNIKSITELQAIDGQYPCEDDQEYIDEEKRILIAPKSDMKTRLEIETTGFYFKEE